ncbi:hypothetical protein EPUS_05409 [Endocarpon pusillum Z07020]|uniref:DNA/RNA-binding domain-containing protein n=1 Tax=Endocarpon pusillum (strain Z07020 / HMAS-L-300199) TaxID=1263415 RepID=U1FY73_ENDPU|nr:uncharacterized protein EPUS_05409 [Endocarpon pusillum Z07020]ERF69867.1 hypothetical protein EPUS_05409 [Endocarpon pusillum Z07020]
MLTIGRSSWYEELSTLNLFYLTSEDLVATPAKYRSVEFSVVDHFTTKSQTTRIPPPTPRKTAVDLSTGHTSGGFRFYPRNYVARVEQIPCRMNPKEQDNVVTYPSNSIESGQRSPSFEREEPDSGIFLHPESRPITQEQLVHEVKGIYAGLVMVKNKCLEIDQQQATTTTKLGAEQWQALVALHRTLLHEHHDFFLASQHPSSSPALGRLATKYSMPTRMWRHGIHSFLELLRYRLLDLGDHMTYSMMAFLTESVPGFEETWIECLDDLTRYRMAIEEADIRDRKLWAAVAKMWYDKADDRSLHVGRIQHHFAVLARPSIVNFFNTTTTQESPDRQTEVFPRSRACPGPLLPKDCLLRDLTAASFHSSAKNHSQMWPPVGVVLSQPHDAAAEKDCLGEQVQNITPRPAHGYPKRGNWTGCVTDSRNSSTLTFPLRMISPAILNLGLVYLALSRIPVAFAEQVFEPSQGSNRSSWIGALLLSFIIGVAGRMTKGDLGPCLASSIWLGLASAAVWTSLDGLMRCAAVAGVMIPLLTTALHRAENRRQSLNFRRKESDDMMEKAGIDSGDEDDSDEDYDSSVLLDWTAEPRGRDGSTAAVASLVAEEMSRSQTYEDRDSSPESFNGTYGFER